MLVALDARDRVEGEFGVVVENVGSENAFGEQKIAMRVEVGELRWLFLSMDRGRRAGEKER